MAPYSPYSDKWSVLCGEHGVIWDWPSTGEHYRYYGENSVFDNDCMLVSEHGKTNALKPLPIAHSVKAFIVSLIYDTGNYLATADFNNPLCSVPWSVHWASSIFNRTMFFLYFCFSCSVRCVQIWCHPHASPPFLSFPPKTNRFSWGESMADIYCDVMLTRLCHWSETGINGYGERANLFPSEQPIETQQALMYTSSIF